MQKLSADIDTIAKTCIAVRLRFAEPGRHESSTTTPCARWA